MTRHFNGCLHAPGIDTVMAAPFATVGTALWIAIAYKFNQSLVDMVTGAQDVTRQEEPRLYNLLENLCISRGIPMPKLKIMEDSSLNAFASGMNEKQYAVTVTTGLLNALDDAEIEAVLGHELTHIRNGDVRMLVIAVIIAGVISFFAEMFFRMFFYSRGLGALVGDSDRGKGGAGIAIVISVALIAVAWFLSVVIRFALSRKREFLADAGSVELTKNPDAMISALRKIENRGELHAATSAVMEMCVDNPREGIADLFATHPSVDSRVDALVQASRAGTTRARSPCRNSMPSRRSFRSRTPRCRSRLRPTDLGGRTVPASRSCPRVRPSISPHLRPDRRLVAPIPHHGDRRVDRVANGFRLIACLAALAVAGCTAVSDPAGYAIASQDRYDFMTCKEIINNRNAQTGRMKQLAEQIEKAEASPGGFIVSAAAYRSEYVQARALAAAADRAARLNNCDAPKPN